MEVIKLAWYNERFSYRGKQFVLPPDDVPDRGTIVDDLTLIPKPRRNVDIYQPVTSPETIEYVPTAGHKAVYWLQNADSQKQKWDRYAEIREAVRQRRSARARIAAWCSTSTSPTTREQALVKGRPGQDEFNKFLSPYGRFSSYRNPDGSEGRRSTTARPSRRATSRRSRSSARSTTPSTPSAIWRDLLDLKHICFFFDYPGLTREEMNEQMHLVAEEVFPRLGEPIERRPLTGSPLV